MGCTTSREASSTSISSDQETEKHTVEPKARSILTPPKFPGVYVNMNHSQLRCLLSYLYVKLNTFERYLKPWVQDVCNQRKGRAALLGRTTAAAEHIVFGSCLVIGSLQTQQRLPLARSVLAEMVLLCCREASKGRAVEILTSKIAASE